MKIFIGHLDTQVSEQQLCDLFAEYGRVEAAYIPRDDSGNPRGFGYVIMAGDTMAEIAIRALNKIKFMGQYLVVSEAISSVRFSMACN